MDKAKHENLSMVRGNVVIVGADIGKNKNIARFIDRDGFERGSDNWS